MINELIEAVGYDNIIQTISENIDTENSLYVKIPTDRMMMDEDFLYVKKEVDIKDLKMSEWFTKREVFSRYIESNKAIVQGNSQYPKMILSSVPYAVIFKWDNFINHKLTDKSNIEESMSKLLNEYTEKFNENLIDSYDSCIKNILNYIEKNEIKKVTLKLFVDVDIELYKTESMMYLRKKLFDDGIEKDIDGEVYGRVSQFITLNANKPLLGHMINVTDDIHLTKESEMLDVYYLKKYLDIAKNKNIKNNVGNVQYKMCFNSNSKKWVMDHYSNNPYEIIDDLNEYIYVTDQLNGKTDEFIIKTYNDLTKHMLRLTDFKVKGFYVKGDNVEEKFKTFSSMYYTHISNINNTVLDTFKQVYDKLITNLLRLYIYDEDVYKIKNILNFDICMRDYLFNNNYKEDLKFMFNNIKDKVINMRDMYEIESDEEFFMICGQMAKYFKSKTRTDNKTNELYTSYLMANKTKQIMSVLRRDKTHLDYDSGENSRSNRMMSGLIMYYEKNKDRIKNINHNYFNIGLYNGNCIVYAKKEENK